ncbi:MAG: hypothetical protein MUF24_12760 [Chitinophagaceae bacterium]|jgi:hypothetical protein|nr:hypothetical protein [Chitinophagaceae bacterium]
MKRMIKSITLLMAFTASVAVFAQDDARAILKKASDAVGSAEAIKAVKDITLSGNMSMMGQEFSFVQRYVLPAGFATEMTMGGMQVMKQLKNGEQYSVSMQGAEQEIDEAAKFAMTMKSAFFEEAFMLSTPGFAFAVKPQETEDGKTLNVIEVTMPDGNTKAMYYYDAATGLRVKESREQDGGPMGKATVVNKILEYKEISGVKIPSKLQVQFGPIDQELSYSDIKVNTGLKASEL